MYRMRLRSRPLGESRSNPLVCLNRGTRLRWHWVALAAEPGGHPAHTILRYLCALCIRPVHHIGVSGTLA